MCLLLCLIISHQRSSLCCDCLSSSTAPHIWYHLPGVRSVASCLGSAFIFDNLLEHSLHCIVSNTSELKHRPFQKSYTGSPSPSLFLRALGLPLLTSHRPRDSSRTLPSSFPVLPLDPDPEICSIFTPEPEHRLVLLGTLLSHLLPDILLV